MIGIDIIATDRLKVIREDEYTYWSKYFTIEEWRYCFSRDNPSYHLGGIYAAKEAVIKAVGGPPLGRLDRISVGHDSTGKPNVVISGDENISQSINVSISHDSSIAVAVALLA